MSDNQTHGKFGWWRSPRSERGQALIMITIGIIFLMGILGLVVDVGWGYYRKQVAQAAVDAAVTAAVVNAGSGTITCGSGGVICPSAKLCTDVSITTGSNIDAACKYAASAGIAKSNMTMSADITTPKNGVAVNYWVTATASESLLPTFLQVLGFRGGTVAAAATGGVVAGGGGSGGGCLYIMDPSAGQALYTNGASLSVTCGVYLNSSSSSAFTLNSAASSITAPAGGFHMLTGSGINTNGNGCGCTNAPYNCSGGISCATPSFGAAATDPLASIPAPSVGSCNSLTTSGTGYSWSNLSPPQTLNPGTYCGGIMVGGGNVTFNPGVYILNGGGLTIQGGSNTTVTGTGVTFYNTSAGYTAKSLLVSSQVNLNFKAPTSGAYQGIMFMQDHSVCPSTGHMINGQGGSNTIKINGTIYIHCTKPAGSGYVAQNLLYTGQSTSGYYTALVVDTLQMNGMANLVLDPTGGSNTGIGLTGGSKPFLIQ